MDPNRTSPSETRRRWRGPAIAVAALVVSLAIALPLWFVFRGDDSPPVVTEPTVATTTMPGSTTTILATTTIPATTTTTVPTTTTTVPPIESLWASPFTSVVAVSAEEAWALGKPEARWPVAANLDDWWRGALAHFVDGAWAWVDLPAFDADLLADYANLDWSSFKNIWPVTGLAVAPDGTVWVSTVGGVFSYDGGEWARRGDFSAGGVAVAADGTVWTGGGLVAVQPPSWGGGAWLARRDDRSWTYGQPGPSPAEKPSDMAALPSGEVWLLGGKICWFARDLIHYTAISGRELFVYYDGLSMRETEYMREAHNVGGILGNHSHFAAVEAGPNGEVWTVFYPSEDLPFVVARFDGEVWTFYTPPFASMEYYSWWEDNEQGAMMAVGPDGVVWFAADAADDTDDGLVSFDGTDWTYHVQGRTVSAVDVAPDGTVWYLDEEGPHTLGN